MISIAYRSGKVVRFVEFIKVNMRNLRVHIKIILCWMLTTIHGLSLESDTSIDHPIIIGDIILIDINCYMCDVIKSETSSNYSHSGLVVGDNGSEYLIAQSLGTTEVITSSEFLANRRKGSRIKILRSKELDFLYDENVKEYASRVKLLKFLYLKKYDGLAFDPSFLWNNYDSKGNELLYCAEMIIKVLNEALTNKLIPSPMSFQKNIEYWTNYYGGPPPEGELGVSPGSLERDSKLKVIGEY